MFRQHSETYERIFEQILKNIQNHKDLLSKLEAQVLQNEISFGKGLEMLQKTEKMIQSHLDAAALLLEGKPPVGNSPDCEVKQEAPIKKGKSIRSPFKLILAGILLLMEQ